MNRKTCLSNPTGCRRSVPWRTVKAVAFSGVTFVCLSTLASAEKLAGWEINALSGAGASPYAPTSTNPAVTTVGLTRGSGVTIPASPAASAWGGSGWDVVTTAAAAITANDFATFSITPSNGQPVSIETIEPYSIRRSSSGPATGQWQYQVNSGSFIDIGGPITWGTVTNANGNPQPAINLTSIPDLQSVPAGTTITFRVVNYGSTSTGGTWYFDEFQSGDDLVVSGTTISPPSISSRSPADDATGLALAAIPNLTLSFTEPVTAGTGDVILKKVIGDVPVASFTVDDTNETAISGADVTFFLNDPTPLEVGTAYYVEIPGTGFKDATNSFFTGITGNTGWNFETAGPPPDPTVVINKYSASGSPDTVELLVVGSQVPASTVDLRGMIVKDFSANMTGDGGGKFEFTTDTLWEAVPVGTLVVLTKDATSADTNLADSNYTLRVGLDNANYFTNLGGTFDLSGIEMVMIKAAGSGSAGTVGGVHMLAGGAQGTLYTNYAGAKLIATAGGNGVRVENSTSDLDDFKSGTDATGDLTILPSEFGVANSGGNDGFITTLRGLVPSNGDGIAAVINATPGSPFENKGIFDRGQVSNQTAKVVLNAFIPSVTLTDVKIEVPAAVGTPTPGTVSISGPGATGASFVVSGQTITVSTAAVTTTNGLEVSITGLSTPTPTLVTDNGNYVFDVETSGSGGILTDLATQPAARVLIPIASLRDVDANGVALDAGTIVAVDGVCTEENFGTGNTQAFLQKDGSGVNIFYSVEALSPALVRGNRYAAVGPVLQFNGLTEISLAAATDIVNLGADTEPAPEVVTLATLFAAPETYEGKLITVEGLSYVSGTWSSGQNVVLEDAATTDITVRIQAGSTATPAPTFRADITGIFSQSDSSSPFNSFYQLQPRDAADLESDFDTWALATGATGGAASDSDFDDKDNAFEYAFGLNPTSGGSVNPFIVPFNPATGLFTYSRRDDALTGLTYTYQYSTSLSGTWTAFTPAVTPVSDDGTPVEAITVTVPAALLAGPKLFIRVVTP